jgi:hypothetical protein
MTVDAQSTASGISYAALPRRNYQPASICVANFDAAAKRLRVRPRSFELRPAPGKYRLISLKLASGRYATLTQWASYPESIEISLELGRDHSFVEADLLAVLDVLNVPPKEANRQGAYKWK